MAQLIVKTFEELLAECADEEAKLRKRPKWGPWRFQRRAFALIHDEVNYQIPLERCGTSRAVLDWLAQISHKTWGTPEVVGHLVAALNKLLGWQGSYVHRPTDEMIDTYALLKRKGWVGRQPTTKKGK